MGSYPSSRKQKKVVPYVHLSCRSLCALDGCLQLILRNVNRQRALKSVFLDVTASSTFLDFLLSAIAKDIEKILKSDTRIEKFWSSNNRMFLQNVLQEYCHALEHSIQAVNEIYSDIFEIICGAFPRFLKSEYFHGWQSSVTLDAIKYFLEEDILEITYPELPLKLEVTNYEIADAFVVNKHHSFTQSKSFSTTNDNDQFKMLKTRSNAGPVFACTIDDNITSSTTTKVIENAMDHCDPIEASKILRSRSWLPVFLAMAETLPIGISLSSVKSNNSIFPVIYMNNYLEELIKLKRSHCFDNNFEFHKLVTGINTTDIPSKLSEGTPSVASILKRHRNRTYSETVVGIKPIFDENYKYSYVIGFHLGLDSSRSNKVSTRYKEQNLKFIEKLLDKLPEPQFFHDIVYCPIIQDFINNSN